AAVLAWRQSAVPEEMRVSLKIPPKASTEFAISPDGTSVAFLGLGLQPVWIRRLDSTVARTLSASVQDARFPFWSPDGRFVGFWTSGKLMKMDVGGGPPLVIAE